MICCFEVNRARKIYKNRLSFDRLFCEIALCCRAAKSMSSKARAKLDASSPLDDTSILRHVLNILGPGQHVFVSAVSKAWRDSYTRVASVQMPWITEDVDDEAVLHTITSQTTLCSAVFASAASIRLANECGLTFTSTELQHIAGRVADIATLQAAVDLGLQLTDEVVIGAAEAASLPQLQWLHVQQGCPLPRGICDWAAKSGSMDTLVWLRDHGSAFRSSTCEAAAGGAHLHLLEFLRDQGCEWDEHVCSAAAKSGDLSTLQWLHEQGCPWEPREICDDAAAGGSIEMLLFLTQHGCALNEYTMAEAARKGHLAVCHFLVAEQCPCDATACVVAAAGGHLETVRFLHECGAPWDVTAICKRAVENGSVELLQYLKQQGCVFTAGHMSAAAERGLLHVCQYLRAEQCPWSAKACRTAAVGGHLSTLSWLHEQSCPLGDIQDVRMSAAASGHLCIIKYLKRCRPTASAAQVTQMLSAAGCFSKLSVAQWLRQQGAAWPTELCFNGNDWSSYARQWARENGCTS
jgi:hypothetical protein